MPSFLVVTAINDAYFPLLIELLTSLSLWRAKVSFDVGVMDVGLQSAQRAKLESLGVKTVQPGVDIDYPGRFVYEQERPYFRAMTSRPSVPQYFPGYDVYLWLDADMWVQTPEALMVMFAGAFNNPDTLYIATEYDRDYPLLREGPALWENWYESFTYCLPEEEAKAFWLRPMINVGCFALHAKAPHWGLWQQRLAVRLNAYEQLRPEHFIMEQIMMNVVVYRDKLKTQFMPADFNWSVVHSVPVWHEENKLFGRPSRPDKPLSIIHLTAQTKTLPQEVLTTSGRVLTMPMTFAQFMKLRAGQV